MSSLTAGINDIDSLIKLRKADIYLNLFVLKDPIDRKYDRYERIDHEYQKHQDKLINLWAKKMVESFDADELKGKDVKINIFFISNKNKPQSHINARKLSLVFDYTDDIELYKDINVVDLDHYKNGLLYGKDYQSGRIAMIVRMIVAKELFRLGKCNTSILINENILPQNLSSILNDRTEEIISKHGFYGSICHSGKEQIFGDLMVFSDHNVLEKMANPMNLYGAHDNLLYVMYLNLLYKFFAKEYITTVNDNLEYKILNYPFENMHNYNNNAFIDNIYFEQYRICTDENDEYQNSDQVRNELCDLSDVLERINNIKFLIYANHFDISTIQEGDFEQYIYNSPFVYFPTSYKQSYVLDQFLVTRKEYEERKRLLIELREEITFLFMSYNFGKESSQIISNNESDIDQMTNENRNSTKVENSIDQVEDYRDVYDYMVDKSEEFSKNFLLKSGKSNILDALRVHFNC